MIEQYYGINIKNIGYFAGSVTIATVIATTLFWLVFGFDKWERDITTAQDLMLAAAVNQNDMIRVVPGTIKTTKIKVKTNVNATGQFLCPQDGAVGLPVYDTLGSPHCPLCSQTMMFHSAQQQNTKPIAGTAGG